ncbi:hypothetical protein BB561_003126 [Smittium simulii]|uniref:Uncharacterized protein n=1 Tax=Smittium simulii TaxID=133385 RepID=A0A2T9YMU7_9FUNG|nr:hypothetical protein BB561_003126 [Smittium simulii]
MTRGKKLEKVCFRGSTKNWIADTEAGTSCNWMELELVYSELKTHINYVFKIRNRTHWTARRYTKSLIQPILLSSSISMRLVGKLLGKELKLSSTMICKDPTILCVKTTLATVKFLNAIDFHAI